MALDSNRLGNALAAKIQGARPADGAAMSDSQLQAIWRQIATEVVNEIKNNGEVTVQTSEGPATGTIQ